MEIIAHRGASHDAPENTVAAACLAWEQEADVVEADIRLTKDGRVVVMHDGATDRTTGVSGLIEEMTFDEVRSLDAGKWKGEQWAGEKVPTLEEMLETIPAGKRIFIESKVGPEVVPEFERIVNASGKAPEQIAVISFNIDLCAEVKRALPAHKVYKLSGFKEDEETGAWSPTIDELIDLAKEHGLDGLDIRFFPPMVDEAAIQKIRAAGLEAVVWTIDDLDDARRMVAGGIDGLSTNRPAFMRERLA